MAVVMHSSSCRLPSAIRLCSLDDTLYTLSKQGLLRPHSHTAFLTMSDAGYNIFGVVTGVIGIIGLALSGLYTLVNNQLPSTKIRLMDEKSEDTESLLRSVVEEGLFSGSDFIQAREYNLSRIRVQAEEYRLLSYCATTWLQQIKAIFKGLSHRISLLCEEITQVRAKIARNASGSSTKSACRHPRPIYQLRIRRPQMNYPQAYQTQKTPLTPSPPLLLPPTGRTSCNLNRSVKARWCSQQMWDYRQPTSMT